MTNTKKESALRKTIKDAFASLRVPYALSWVESHATSQGIPDASYCVLGREGWLELKAAPDIEVRATQVRWMENRIYADGYPLFIIQIPDRFLVVPGRWAADIRADPEDENMLRRASRIWTGKIPPDEFLNVLRNPRAEYEK